MFEIVKEILILATLDGRPKKYHEIRKEVLEAMPPFRCGYAYDEVGWNNRELHILVGEESYYRVQLLKYI